MREGIAQMKPNHSYEVFWMALSVLCLPIKEQLEVIGGIPPESEDIHISMHGTNADLLLWLFEEYKNGWLDNIEEGKAYDIIKLIQSGKFPEVTFLDLFINGQPWIELRRLAKIAIKEAKLDLWPIEETIDFYAYIEIQN